MAKRSVKRVVEAKEEKPVEYDSVIELKEHPALGVAESAEGTLLWSRHETIGAAESWARQQSGSAWVISGANLVIRKLKQD